jgi:DNA-binding XRE family transcriptional regulator
MSVMRWCVIDWQPRCLTEASLFPMTWEQLAEIVGENLKAYRKRKAISQETLGDISGVHRTYIGLIEVGKKNVTLSTLVKLGEALDVEPQAFLIKDSHKTSSRRRGS